MSTETNKAVKKIKNKSTGDQDSSSICSDSKVKSLESLTGVEKEDMIFSMDIGTRTIVGIVGYMEKDKFKVAAAEVVEHKSRAMLNGQIHDIEKVAEVAGEVKDKLEKKIGMKLEKVAIAAAGRVLKTCEVKVEREIDPGVSIDRELINGLEMEGIQKAQAILDENEAPTGQTKFYCVGYSVVNYYLNGYVISNLTDHKGKTIAAHILATFLPHVVVDSLYTVMNKVGLEVINLTLEPIAAINVTIPSELRLLNLALVDIGAGTSDIALTRDGSVVAYAMVPVAGDELTERIAREYLLDFNTAEEIKTSLSKNSSDSISFKDIMGKKHVINAAKVLEDIKPSIQNLAMVVSEKILELNQKATNAVFLIGGGSQIPGLTEMIAEILKIPHDRVALRNRDNINNIKFSGKKLSGPEAITPIGIAVTALNHRGHDFLSVTLNGKKIRLFNSKKLTVLDSLVLIGFDSNSLIGRSGKSIRFTLNGEEKFIKGEHGQAARIFVNGEAASLDTVLKPGDQIIVEPSIHGRNAEAKLSDYTEIKPKRSIKFNGDLIYTGTHIFVNGNEVEEYLNMSDGDSILVRDITSVNDLLELYGFDMEKSRVIVNGNKPDVSYTLLEGDVVEVGLGADDKPDFDGFAINDPIINTGEKTNNESFYVTVNGKNTILKGNKPQYIFIDVFNHIDFDLSSGKGNAVFKLNGEKAAFTDEIKPGDVIEISWEPS
ncbi:cell division FtsA domain-containing protein [Pseudobacteroides cellulosolvens]|uniref:Chaperone protein DnaK n=1 Tax=Pseudobacteroides cellulosolvens ATCC 35603 = DSM 2933 TaxID=398512 RepID=A0A0L6JM95_9FIRM|nr:cell division FtsA domain-containing protein [Pseudobacteroides cellulosolvens]KNY26517.1 cell division protein FtsA [Pseudobacteroides cellulosolvens ATCC 35603 = DSM 2933]